MLLHLILLLVWSSASYSSWLLLPSVVLQFQMAHLVPLKPYAAPVPRSQSLCDQPTKTMSAFPTQDPSLTPKPRPNHSRELVRQNSDPTSETPAPQAHQIKEDRGPWIRLPDVELPPKVRFMFDLHYSVMDFYTDCHLYFVIAISETVGKLQVSKPTNQTFSILRKYSSHPLTVFIET